MTCQHLHWGLRVTSRWHTLQSPRSSAATSPDGSVYCFVSEDIAGTAHVCHMSLQLPKPSRTVVALELQLHIKLGAVTLADGGMDLLKHSIIPCFFPWPAAWLFNTYNSMLYRLNYLLQAETNRLDNPNEVPFVSSSFLLSVLKRRTYCKAASLWWTVQLDVILLKQGFSAQTSRL